METRNRGIEVGLEGPIEKIDTKPAQRLNRREQSAREHRNRRFYKGQSEKQLQIRAQLSCRSNNYKHAQI